MDFRIRLLIMIVGQSLSQTSLSQSFVPPDLMGRGITVSNWDIRVYNDGAICNNWREGGYRNFRWPRDKGYVAGGVYEPSGPWFAAKKTGRKLVDPIMQFVPYSWPWYDINPFLPGVVGDPYAAPDTAFHGVGWKYVNDPNYIVYSSRDYDALGVDRSGSNFPDWPIRMVDGTSTYVWDIQSRSSYEPVFVSDEDMFCVYKDTDTRADPEYRGPNANADSFSVPIGIEVHQRVLSWRYPPLNDVTTIAYEVHNKSGEILDSCFACFSMWPTIMRQNIYGVGPVIDTNTFAYYAADPSRNLGVVYNTMLREGVDSICPYLGISFLETPISVSGRELGMTFWREEIYQNSEWLDTSNFNDRWRYETIAANIIQQERTVRSGIGASIHYSVFTGSGPFRMMPGDSVRFVVALIGANGLQKLLQLQALMQSVHDRGFQVPQPPANPVFSFVPLDGAVRVEWDRTAELSVDPIIPDSLGKPFWGYKLYRGRAQGGPYFKIREWNCGMDSVPHEFVDDGRDGIDSSISRSTGLLNNVSYYYKLTAYDQGSPRLNLEPMESNGAFLVATPGAGPKVAGDLSEVRVVPNPFIITHRAQTRIDKPILFFNYLPERCTIRIYTVGLDLVSVIEHEVGATATWDLCTEGGQQVASQLFLAHITTPEGKTVIRKFAVIAGE